jgi:hypothetical protein
MNDDQTRPSDVEPASSTPAAAETPVKVSTADLAGVKADGGPQPANTNGGQAPTAPSRSDAASPLFAAEEATGLRGRWDDVQAGFIDEPRKAVEEADSLVAAAMTRLAEIFAAERSRLEGAWDRGDDVSTEDLRLALQRYRSFFGRLLSV